MSITQEPIFLLIIATLGPSLTEWIKAVGTSRDWILPKQLAPLISLSVVMVAGLIGWAADPHNANAFSETVKTLLAASAIGQSGHTVLSTAKKRSKGAD